jgi:uncharacterized protein (DUF2236 family)
MPRGVPCRSIRHNRYVTRCNLVMTRSAPMSPLKKALRSWVLKAFPRDPARGVDYLDPRGDAGLFGPDSVTWRIHADFPGMLAGGLCALMLQTLHPRALAAVWDFSGFRQDLLGRLRRTTSFVGGTTYAPCVDAQRMIGQVRSIHAGIRGTTADGMPYSADDPELLVWVHVTEAYAFLQGYRTYGPVPVPDWAADAYYDEVRRIAEALGARDVPANQVQVHDYLLGVRDQLRFDERSREVLRILGTIRLPVPAPGLSRELFMHAGAALLPAWAGDMLGHTSLQRVRMRIARDILRGLAPVFRAALPDGIAAQSCRRLGRDPQLLRRFVPPLR